LICVGIKRHLKLRQKEVMDMKMCDDFLKFLIENVRLGY